MKSRLGLGLMFACVPLPDEPGASPSRPEQVPHQPFRFPQNILGYMFLRKYGMSKEVRASIIRSAQGSTRLDALEKELRSAEVETSGLRASRAAGAHWLRVPDKTLLDPSNEPPQK